MTPTSDGVIFGPDDDIVAQLRAFVDYYGTDPGVPMSAVDTAAQAADEIERLRAEVTRLHSLIVRLGVAPQPGYVGPTVF